jgi:ABC-type Fe3+/spermidine/putrescine transport system ATPase subunit
MSEKSVEIENLTVRFGNISALDNVSFDVKKGEFFVVMGRSPSGKSVLLRCIQGLQKKYEGKIVIDGKDMKSVPAYKRDISTVFQSYALFPHMRVKDNISFGLKMRGFSGQQVKSAVDEVMSIVRLTGLGDRRITELSGGQQQRVALARALVVKPKIILFDEPLLNLDFKLRLEMQEELISLHEKIGITFIYVTHSREQALSLADRILVLHKGIVQQLGEPADLYEHPQSLSVASFIGDINLFEGELVSVKDGIGSVKTDLGVFTGSLDNKISTGKRITYGIRPEAVIISPDTKETHNKIKAIYQGSLYKGYEIEHYFRLSNKKDFKVIGRGRRATTINERLGNPMILGWNPEQAVILEEHISA